MAPDPQVRQRFKAGEHNDSQAPEVVEKVSVKVPERIVTKIHGKCYDLLSFTHPGGPIALAMVNSRDATELFESHHQFTKKDVEDILKQYEISEKLESIKGAGVYDWQATKSDPFTIELKETARKLLG